MKNKQTSSSSTEIKTWKIHFSFEWMEDSPFWSDNEEGFEKFGNPCRLESLPISDQLRARCTELRDLHDSSLNWDYPPDPGPLRQHECDQINSDIRELFEQAKVELGKDFELTWRQHELKEDPDLDEYLKNPKEFKREK